MARGKKAAKSSKFLSKDLPVILEWQEEANQQENRESQLNGLESSFAKFYRCHLFPRKCQFATKDADEFKRHLETSKHPGQGCCFYCRSKDFTDIDTLVTHYAWEHGNLVVQCNLCLFRASQVLHLVLHHISCHLLNYVKAIMGDKGDERLRSMGTSKIIICKSPLVHARHFDLISITSTLIGKSIEDSDDLSCPYCYPMSKFVSPDLLLSHQLLHHYGLPVSQLGREEKAAPQRKIASKSTTSSSKSGKTRSDFFPGSCNDTEIEVAVDPGLVLDDLDMSDEDYEPSKKSQRRSKTSKVAFKAPVASKTSKATRGKTTSTPLTSPRASTSTTTVEPVPSTSFADDNLYNPQEDEKVGENRPRDSSSSGEEFAPVKKGLRPDSITPLRNKNVTSSKWVYCVLCKKSVIDSKKMQHMRQIHQTDSTIKCRECDYFSANAIAMRAHHTANHNGDGVTNPSIRVLIPTTDKDQVPTREEQSAQAGPVICAPKATARKSMNPNSNCNTGNNSNASKSGKKGGGNLMEKVKSSTYLGPSKDQRTDKGAGKKSA